MPMKWVEPDKFMTCSRGNEVVTVYHAYKDCDYNRPLTFHYSMSSTDDNDTFDVRDLQVVQKNRLGLRDLVLCGDVEAIQAVITMAVRDGELKPSEE